MRLEPVEVHSGNTVLGSLAVEELGDVGLQLSGHLPVVQLGGPDAKGGDEGAVGAHEPGLVLDHEAAVEAEVLDGLGADGEAVTADGLQEVVGRGLFVLVAGGVVDGEQVVGVVAGPAADEVFAAGEAVRSVCLPQRMQGPPFLASSLDSGTFVVSLVFFMIRGLVDWVITLQL
ncbi:hypothetical protein PG997_011532 [Apiospora hydei]|uniref:Uncharacterized protein n=1 Tax=Apiospora hydei TaxID=1337664 RepID=A0ABR1VN37_9PEZI